MLVYRSFCSADKIDKIVVNSRIAGFRESRWPVIRLLLQCKNYIFCEFYEISDAFWFTLHLLTTVDFKRLIILLILIYVYNTFACDDRLVSQIIPRFLEINRWWLRQLSSGNVNTRGKYEHFFIMDLVFHVFFLFFFYTIRLLRETKVPDRCKKCCIVLSVGHRHYITIILNNAWWTAACIPFAYTFWKKGHGIFVNVFFL